MSSVAKTNIDDAGYSKHSGEPKAGTVHWLETCIARGRNEFFSERIKVSPGLAQELLKRNPDNRYIRNTKVDRYSTDMRAGRWVFNGEPIIISVGGLLNNGQHRLTAIIEANMMVVMAFSFGLDRETRLTVDQGAAKGANDYLAMEGIENATVAATIARLLIAIEREKYERLFRENDVTNSEIRERVTRDPQIGEAATYATTANRYSKQFVARGVIGTAYYMLSNVDADAAREYMDQVCMGEGLVRKDPAYAVRRTLMSMGNNGRAAKLEAIFRGWVKYRCNQPLQVAKIIGSFPALV